MKGRRFHVRVLPRSCSFVVVLAAAMMARAADQPPLHERIDALVEAAHVGTPTRLATDGEFLRRVYLDLAGRIPTSDEARAFLADTSPNKRAAVVDQLLASPQHVRHMTTVFDVMLMERRTDKHVPTAEWRQYLYDSFAANKPYNKLVAELLAADGTPEKIRAAAKFYLDREAEPNLLTRDVGRLFFGKDVQCAQCHDHPLIADYYQSDYYGLFAFFGRTSLFTDAKDNNKGYLAEKGDGDLTVAFKSVFTEEEGATGPRLIGAGPLEEPVFAKGDEYQVKPDKDVRPVPKYSRRERLAEELGKGENVAFRRNIANRLWAMLMGRGLVDPIDLHHSANPAIHATLLEMLANDFAAMNFDMRAMLREIAVSRTYQRAFEPPADWNAAIQVAAADVTTLESAVAAATSQQETATAAHRAAEEALKTQREQLAPQRAAYDQARTAAAEADAAARTAAAAVAGTDQQLAAKRPILEAVTAAATASQQAAEKLADAPEAAAAAAKFQAHADKLKGEVAALEAALPEQQKTAAEKQQAGEQAQLALTQATEQWTAASAPLIELEKQLAVAATELRAAVDGHVVAARRLETAKVASQTQPVLASALAAQQAVVEAEKQLAALETQQTELAAQLAAREIALAAAQQAHDTYAANVKVLADQLAARREATSLVALATAKLRDASAALPDDGELNVALTTLTTQQNRLAATTATAEQQAGESQTMLGQLDADRAAAASALADTKAALATVQQQLAAAGTQLASARTAAETQVAAVPAALTALEDAWTKQLALAPLKPLSPEQLGWSILQATGVLANYRTATEAELKAKPEMASLAPAAFEVELEKAVNAKLEGTVTEFVRLFGAGAGQPQNTFFATVDQALFLANGGSLRPWLAPSGNNLTARLAKLDDPAKIAEELYLTVFTRMPLPEETALVATALSGPADQRSEILQELAWGVITSAEFRFCP